MMNGQDAPGVSHKFHHETSRSNGSNSYRIQLSRRLILATLLPSMFLAFAVGQASRRALLQGQVKSDGMAILDKKAGDPIKLGSRTSKIFDFTRSAPSSSWIQQRPLVRGDVCSKDENGSETVPVPDAEESSEDNEEEDLVELTPGAAEHLMVDMRGLDGSFLNSEYRLATAMTSVINEVGLTLLSYHCHGLFPVGVTCVGVLAPNYISFHTWPVEGVIILDLFSGQKSIHPAIRAVKRHFGVPAQASGADLHGGGVEEKQLDMRWALRARGFVRDDDDEKNAHFFDLRKRFLEDLRTDSKEEIVSISTHFQRIDIYDNFEQSMNREHIEHYRRSLSGDGSFFARNPFPFRPERTVMLDGLIQSTLFSEGAYHEALVHPALFSHSNPKRVSIIGGGEMATLREVLKHNTIEEVVMIEIDEMMVNISRQYLPEWSECSDLIGSSAWCGDDTRAKVFYEDAFAWFMDRYSSSGDKPLNALFDVIIMDALDPESEIPIAKQLYGSDSLMRTFYDSLSEDGILVMQLGEAPFVTSPSEQLAEFKNRAATISYLESVGFESIHTYEESHCDFDAPWTFVVAFKSYSTRQRWYAEAAHFDVDIQKRAVRTKSGNHPLRYFDGPTMFSYQVPSRGVENIFCRRTPTPEACLETYNYDPSKLNVSQDSSVEVSAVEGKAFAKVDIPERAYFAAETGCHPMIFMPSTVALIEGLENEEVDEGLKAVGSYMNAHGYVSRLCGDGELIKNSGLLAFTIHGNEETEWDEPSRKPTMQFNPVIERHLGHASMPRRPCVTRPNDLVRSCVLNVSEGET